VASLKARNACAREGPFQGSGPGAQQLDGADPASQGFGFGAILVLAGRAAHLEAVGQPSLVRGLLFPPALPGQSSGESSIETFPTSLAAPVRFNALLRPKEAQQALSAGRGFAAEEWRAPATFQVRGLPNNSMEPTRPAGCLVWRDTSLGWPGGSSRGR
jgi:hypothetical protein